MLPAEVVPVSPVEETTTTPAAIAAWSASAPGSAAGGEVVAGGGGAGAARRGDAHPPRRYRRLVGQRPRVIEEVRESGSAERLNEHVDVSHHDLVLDCLDYLSVVDLVGEVVTEVRHREARARGDAHDLDVAAGRQRVRLVDVLR